MNTLSLVLVSKSYIKSIAGGGWTLDSYIAKRKKIDSVCCTHSRYNYDSGLHKITLVPRYGGQSATSSSAVGLDLFIYYERAGHPCKHYDYPQDSKSEDIRANK